MSGILGSILAMEVVKNAQDLQWNLFRTIHFLTIHSLTIQSCFQYGLL
jgi:hypothetical protein